jgi:hypothetical protein
MNDSTKATPGGAPDDRRTLADKLGPAETEPRAPAGIRVRLDVEGGSMPDRYELHFEATGAGDVQASVVDGLRGLEAVRNVGQVPPEQIRDIFKSLDVADFADVRRRLPPIPPDSTIGILTVSAGRDEETIVFMVDEGQAESAGFELPPNLRRAVDGIYEVAARQLDRDSIRP